MRHRKLFVAISAAVLMTATSGVALAEDVGDKQGWCKKQQGNSNCAGQSECSKRGQEEAPRGQAKKC